MLDDSCHWTRREDVVKLSPIPLSAQGGLNLRRADLERSVNLPSKGILGRNLEGFNAHTILLIMSHSSAARLEGDPS